MEKILLVIDAANPDIPALDFACYVAGLTRSTLTGLFIDSRHKEEPVTGDACSIPVRSHVMEHLAGRTTWPSSVHDSIQLFDNICLNRCVRNDVKYMHAPEMANAVIAESRFADLLILKPETSVNRRLEKMPSSFTTALLANAECPVLIAPPDFTGIDEIIFAYDGSKSSVFAIKQFTHLFPRLSDKRAMILEVTGEANGGFTEKEKIGELLKAHFSGIGYHLLHGKATTELMAYLIHKKTSMVVMGAYGRSMFTKLPVHSTATPLLQTINCPFFITHC